MKDRKDKIMQGERTNNPTILYSKFIKIPSGRDVRFARIFDKEVYLEHVTDMVELANRSLPEEYERIENHFFTDKSTTGSDGITYDLIDQWQGQTFLILDSEDNLIGFTLGNTSENKETKAGFSRLTIVEENYHREGLGSVLVGLLNKTFIKKGVQVLRGSIEANNMKMRSLIENVSTHQSVDGKFLRYDADMNTMNLVSGFLTSKISYYDELIDTFGLD